MAFNNLKTLKLQEITGSQLAQVGDIFTDTSSRSDFTQLSEIKNAVINSKTFTGGLPFPDSIKIKNTIAENNTKTLKPSDIYPNDLDSDKYLVKVLGYAMSANDLSASADIGISNGSLTIPLKTSTRSFDFETTDFFISEDNYLSITEGAGLQVQLLVLTGIVSRGGV